MMNALQGIFNANFIGQIKLTTLLSCTSLVIKDYLFKSAFHSSTTNTLKDIIKFLTQKSSLLMIVVYHYQKFVNNNRDKDAQLRYYNMFDAMMDTLYVAFKKLGVEDVALVGR